MAGYYLAVGAIMALVSSAMIAWPQQTWQFTRGWRFANPEAVRLSDSYVGWLRLSGAVGLVMGICFLVYAFR